MYKLSLSQMATKCELYNAVTVNIAGIEQQQYNLDEKMPEFFCDFKSYGGTEVQVNGVITVQDTALIKTRFYPEIVASSRIKVLKTGKVYEVLGAPEDIENRGMWMQFKVRLVDGGA